MVDDFSEVVICWVVVSVMGLVVTGFFAIVDNTLDDKIFDWILYLISRELQLYHQQIVRYIGVRGRDGRWLYTASCGMRAE